MRLPVFLLTLCALAGGCALPVTDVPSAPVSGLEAEIRHETGDILEKNIAAMQRLWSAGGPLLFKNAPLCPKRASSPGFVVVSDFDLAERLRGVALERAGIGREAVVLTVVPGTDAWTQGVLPGDTLLTLEGKRVRNAADARARLRSIKGKESAVFGFVRQGRSFARTIRLEPFCNYPLVYDPGVATTYNAQTDGKTIHVGQMLLDSISDDELASAVAHELAHNVMHHRAKKEQNGILLMIAGGIADTVTGTSTVSDFIDRAYTNVWSPRFEKEADYVGLYLIARAGGNIEAAAPFWRKFAATTGMETVRHNPLFVHTHPPSPERFAVLRETEKEIRAKIANGETLMPNLKSPWNFGARYSWWNDSDESDDEPDDVDLNH